MPPTGKHICFPGRPLRRECFPVGRVSYCGPRVWGVKSVDRRLSLPPCGDLSAKSGRRGNILETFPNVSPSELQNARPTGKHLKMFPRRPRRRPPRRRPRRERRRPKFWHLRANGETFWKMFPRCADRSDGETFPHRRDGETFPIPPTGKHSRMFPRRGRLDGETLSTFPVSGQKCSPVAGTRALGECSPVGPAGRRPQQKVSPFLGFG